MTTKAEANRAKNARANARLAAMESVNSEAILAAFNALTLSDTGEDTVEVFNVQKAVNEESGLHAINVLLRSPEGREHTAAKLRALADLLEAV